MIAYNVHVVNCLRTCFLRSCDMMEHMPFGKRQEWTVSHKMATSKDVARLAGVSHTTVSRAYQKNSSIRPETYERIMKAARELNYAPDTIAASLRGQRTKTVGVIIPHTHVTLFMHLTQTLETELMKHGYRMVVSFDEGDADQQTSALRMMAGNRVDSIVYIPVPQQDPAKEREWMRSTNILFVQFTVREYDELCSFLFDDVAGMLAGMRHLLAHGHRRILMLGGENRVQGFYRAYEEIGEIAPIPYTSLEELTVDECRERIRQLIEQYDPSAIFSISDQVSVIAYGVLMEMRKRVPEDVSLLVFDEAFWSTSLRISAIGHPVASMAQAMVHQILNYAKGASPEELPTSTVYVPYLIERNTVAKYLM